MIRGRQRERSRQGALHISAIGRRDGRWRARLERGERWAELWAGEGLDWIQVFTGNDRRDLSIALEPMTCGPNAFNPGPTHDDMIIIPAGASVTREWGIDGG